MEHAPGEPEDAKLTGQELPGMPNHMVPYARLLDGTILPDDVPETLPKEEQEPSIVPKVFVRPRGAPIKSRHQQGGGRAKMRTWKK
jgi:hypothetical protein